MPHSVDSSFAEHLSDRERSIFLLRYVEELSLDGIRYCTRLKAGTVKVYVARTSTKVRMALRETNK